jgi:hypothetical protein
MKKNWSSDEKKLLIWTVGKIILSEKIDARELVLNILIYFRGKLTII